jgi:hypothetical protein
VRRSVLLQKTYSVHHNAIQELSRPDPTLLWQRELGVSDNDDELIPLVITVLGYLRAAYVPYVPKSASNQPSETLLTKNSY